MKRSSSIQPVKSNIRFPSRYQKVFDVEKFHILQRIKCMIETTTKPLTLLLVSPKQSQVEIVPMKKQPITSRRNLNLKLLESDKKHQQCQEIAAAVHKCYHMTSTNGVADNQIMEKLQIVRENALRSNRRPIKSLAFSMLEKIKEKLYRNRFIEIRTTQNSEERKCASRTSTSRTIYRNPNDFRNSLTHNQIIPIQDRSKLFSTRPSSTFNRISRNSILALSQSNDRRQSMPKIIKKTIMHRASCASINKIDEIPKVMTCQTQVEKVIDDIPLAAWGNDVKLGRR